MRHIGKASLAAVLLAVASTANAGDPPTALERIERHYLCRTQACFDPLGVYDNAASGHVQFRSGAWQSPSGLTCTHSYAVNRACAVFTVNKDELKAALGFTLDDELIYLVGQRMRVGRLAFRTNEIPFVIKDISVTDSEILLYGGDKPYPAQVYSVVEGVSIYP